MYVYFIVSKDALKIGVAKEIKHRLFALQTASPYKLKVINSIFHYSKDTALRMEKTFHKALRKYHLTGEWFSIDALNDIDFETKTIVWGDGGLHFTAQLDGR